MTQPVGATLADVAWIIGNGLVMWAVSEFVASWITDKYYRSRFDPLFNFIGLFFIILYFVLEFAFGGLVESLSEDMSILAVLLTIVFVAILYVGVVLVFAGVRILLYRKWGKGYRPFGHI